MDIKEHYQNIDQLKIQRQDLLNDIAGVDIEINENLFRVYHELCKHIDVLINDKVIFGSIRDIACVWDPEVVIKTDVTVTFNDATYMTVTMSLNKDISLILDEIAEMLLSDEIPLFSYSDHDMTLNINDVAKINMAINSPKTGEDHRITFLAIRALLEEIRLSEFV